MDDASFDAAVRAAFAARNGAALEALAKAQESLTECAHEHPSLHRIHDVSLGSRGSVRVLRCTACQGRLYLRLQTMAACRLMGLSINLTLDQQLAFVERTERESKEPGAAPKRTRKRRR